MAPLKWSKVVSFSSEDPIFPAANVLGAGKWKCKDEGEKQAWVILQLEQTSNITSIDVGNEGAAFVEVQVGRLGMDPDQFKVLLVASSFMSVNESRVEQNKSRVRMFSQEKLSTEVAKEKWDLVKLIATQPFNSHVRYGISFVSVGGPEAVKKTVPGPSTSRLGAFKLKTNDSENLSVGSYFAKRISNEGVQSPSVAASLRSEATLAEIALDQAKKEENKRKRTPEKEPLIKVKQKPRKETQGLSKEALAEAKKRKVYTTPPRRDILPGEDTDEPEQSSSTKVLLMDNKITNPQKDTPKKVQENKMIIPKDSRPQKNEAHKKTNKTRPFNKLLEGVMFTISGFQNPLRGEIRQKALDMGAKYAGDWNSSCTHLVCAFPNTPKFQQVAAAKGKIVKREWIEENHRTRKRLPWRRFCLDRKDVGKPESEEEIWEEEAKSSLSNNQATSSYKCDMDTDEEIENMKKEEKQESEECDTEEEIERVKKEEELRKVKLDAGQNSLKEGKNTKNKQIKRKVPDKYECDTDEDSNDFVDNSKDVGRSTSKKDDGSNSKFTSIKAQNYNDTYDADTDDEEDERTKSTLKVLDVDEDDPYEVDTDIDESEAEKYRPKTDGIALESLPKYFQSKTFYLHGSFSDDQKYIVRRYIVGFGGKTSVSIKSANIVLTVKSLTRKLEIEKDVEILRPEWVLACCDKRMLVDCDQYRVTNE